MAKETLRIKLVEKYLEAGGDPDYVVLELDESASPYSLLVISRKDVKRNYG